MGEVLSFLGTKHLNLKVFASVIEKSLLPADQILKQSFENVACQFDQYLANIYHAPRTAARFQMADMIAYAMFRHFESGDSKLYSQVAPHFYHCNGINCGMTATVSDAVLAALAPALTITPTAFCDTVGVDEQIG